MPQAQGEVTEIWFEEGPGGRQLVAGRIACPPGVIPAPGQYLLAHAPELSAAPLPVAVFASHTDPQSLVAAPGLPSSWLPGMRLDLRGPLGRGFTLPPSARRLALACSGLPHRLFGLVERALARGCAAVLFCDAPIPSGLPVALEVSPLSELEANRDWADFWAVDLEYEITTEPTENTEKNKKTGVNGEPATGNAGPSRSSRKNSVLSVGSVVSSLPGQALIHTAMPCAGIAECGACAVRTRQGWKLACKDGPVFDLSDLELNR